MADNMRIWREVDRTDPAHTKKVSFGREFTSIDAHYQVMRATEEFGPVGEGWTYITTFGYETIPIGGDAAPIVWCDMAIMWGPSSVSEYGTRTFANQYGPIRCSCPVAERGRFDKDAPKKAMTDCLTKGLSHLGFNADVFLGKFDDNAYVQKMRQEFAAEKPASVNAYEAAVKAATTLEELTKVNADFADAMKEAKSQNAAAVTAAVALWRERKLALEKSTPKETT